MTEEEFAFVVRARKAWLDYLHSLVGNVLDGFDCPRQRDSLLQQRRNWQRLDAEMRTRTFQLEDEIARLNAEATGLHFRMIEAFGSDSIDHIRTAFDGVRAEAARLRAEITSLHGHKSGVKGVDIQTLPADPKAIVESGIDRFRQQFPVMAERLGTLPIELLSTIESQVFDALYEAYFGT